MADNIISFIEKRKKFDKAGCKHLTIIVTKEFSNVECKDCGVELNPIWVLLRLAENEKSLVQKLNQKAKLFDNISKKLSEKRKTKCKHCGKFTDINIKMSSLEWRGWE